MTTNTKKKKTKETINGHCGIYNSIMNSPHTIITVLRFTFICVSVAEYTRYSCQRDLVVPQLPLGVDLMSLSSSFHFPLIFHRFSSISCLSKIKNRLHFTWQAPLPSPFYRSNTIFEFINCYCRRFECVALRMLRETALPTYHNVFNHYLIYF